MKQAFFIFLITACLVVVYKTIHYMRYFADKKLYCWLYFGRNEIMLSSTANRRVAKERQNALSIMAVVSFILASCMYFLMY